MSILRILPNGNLVEFEYSIIGKSQKGLLRLNHINADIQSALELAVGDCYRLEDLPSPDLVIDGGGNTGLFANAACARWPGANVIVCEPVPQNISLIHDVLALNSFGQCVSVQLAALSATAGYQECYYREANQGRFDLDLPWTEEIVVPTVRLSELISETSKGITLIKFDIEGAEIDVLRDYFSSEKIVRTIIVLELHSADVNPPYS